MKKAVIILSLVIVISGFCGCSKNKKTGTRESGKLTSVTDIGKKETEKLSDEKVDAHNRTLIAEALEVDENDSCLDSTLSILHTIHAGAIQSAKFGFDDPDYVLKIVAEDGTRYQMYLSSGVYVFAVKNLDTGEWPIKSYA